MHSYLIHGKEEKNIDKFVEKLVTEFKAVKINFTIEKISDTRELADISKLKVSHPTCVIIKNIDRATNEALNAFLKNLEEPQENIFYILTAQSSHTVLPTIASRCQIINAGGSYAIEDGKRKVIETFLSKNSSDKITYLNSMVKRDEALDFAKNIILISHQNLITADDSLSNILTIVKSSQRLYNYLKGNGNVNLALTNFVLDLAEIKVK